MPATHRRLKRLFALADHLLPTPSGPRLLIYHQVGVGLGRQMEVMVEDFVRQLDWLEENREVVGLGEALSRWNEAGSDRLVVLTFDDGYRDVYTVAYPRLEERRLPFTLYLTTHPIELGLPLAHPSAPPLSWSQVEAMAESGLATIGAHTHTHPDLRRASLDQIEAEMETCDRLIERRLGAPPADFAYPWGYWSPAADVLVRSRYRSAALAGAVRFRQPVDPYRLSRYPVQLSDGFRHFPARVEGGFRLEEAARRIAHRYFGP